MGGNTRPSIAELQRITRTTCQRCGGPAGACASAPLTIAEQAANDAVLRAATPVLIRIAAAAPALRADLEQLAGLSPHADDLLEALGRLRP